MTVPALASVICLASGIFGRPAWTEEKCLARAEIVVDVARRHGLDPLLLLAIDVVECDLNDRDARIYKKVGGKKRLVGHDACPMGVRIMGPENRSQHDDASLHELAAKKLARWRKWCRAGHPGGKYRGTRAPHHFVAHYNEGNPIYADQVLAVRDALERVRSLPALPAAEHRGRAWEGKGWGPPPSPSHQRGKIARTGPPRELVPRIQEIVRRLLRAHARENKDDDSLRRRSK